MNLNEVHVHAIKQDHRSLNTKVQYINDFSKFELGMTVFDTETLNASPLHISSSSKTFRGELLPKVNQIIRNSKRTTTSNLNVVQPTVYKISQPQDFVEPFFKKSSVHQLFLQNWSQKFLLFFQDVVYQ